MNICNRYSINCRYDFSHYKSSVVTFGETKTHHFESLKNREWLPGDTKVKELYEYKDLGVLKNYVGSFSSNIDDNIDKTRKKLVCYFLPSESQSSHSSGVKPACPCCCMVLGFLRLLQFTVKTGVLPVLVSQKYFLRSQVCTWASTSSVVMSKLS